MKTVRGIAADESKGGKVVDGFIIGAKKSIVRYEVDGRLYDSKSEAHQVELGMELNEKLHDILQLNLMAGRSMTPREIVGRIREHGFTVKQVLQAPRYAPLFRSQQAIAELTADHRDDQEKEEVIRDFSHLKLKVA